MKHNSLGSAWRDKRFRAIAIVSGLLLWLSFGWNFFGVGQPYFFSGFQKDSEQLVVKQVECRVIAGQTHWPWQLELSRKLIAFDYAKADYHAIQQPGCDHPALVPYDSQFGLQGRVIAALAPTSVAALQAYFAITETLVAGAMVLVILGWAWWVYRRFGAAPAIAVLGLCMLSPWLAAMSRNMYWMLFLSFLPFLWSWFYYPRAGSGRSWRIYLGGVALLIFIKCLCGYEYISAVLMATVTPVLFHELLQSKAKRLRDWAWPIGKRLLLVGSFGVLGFVLAIAVQVLDMTPQKGSLRGAAQTVVQRAFDRTVSGVDTTSAVVDNFKLTLPDAAELIERYESFGSLKARAQKHHAIAVALVVVNYALTPVLWLPIQPAGLLPLVLQSFALWGGVGLWLAIRTIRREGYQTPLGAFAASTIFALAGSLSWLLLATNHTTVHAHLNPIVYYLPFLPMAFVLFGAAVQKRFSGRKR